MMMSMPNRRLTAAAATLLLATIAAGPAGPTKADAAKADGVLELLHARGADLKAFTADVRMTDHNVMMGDTTRTGEAQYQVEPDGDIRLHVLLKTHQFGQKQPTPEKKEYLLDAGWLTDRSYDHNVETRRQVARVGERTSVFDVGKGGAFPLPIGQDPAAVHKLFDVTVAPPDKDDPPGQTVHLTLTPKDKTPLAKQYEAIDVWVDTAQRMPVRVQTFDRGGAKDRQVDFTKLAINPPLADAVFTLPVVAGMKTTDVPLPDESARK